MFMLTERFVRLLAEAIQARQASHRDEQRRYSKTYKEN